MSGILFALAAAFLWGTLPVYLRVAAEYMPIVTIVWFRYTFAFFGLYLFQSLRNKGKAVVINPTKAAILCGFFLTLSSVFYTKGAVIGGPTTAELLIKISQPMTIAASFILFGERFSRLQFGGMIIAFVGFYLFYTGKSEVLEDLKLVNASVLLILIAAACWCTFAIIQKKLTVNHSSTSINLIIYATGGVMLLPFVNWSSFEGQSLYVWILVISTGLNTLLGYGAYGEATSRISLSQTTMIITLSPIFTLLTMKLLSYYSVTEVKEEHIGLLSLIGVFSVILGVMMVVIKPSRKLKKSSQPKEISPEGPH